MNKAWRWWWLLCLMQAYPATVVDYTDLPFEIEGLIQQTQAVAATIDQLIVVLDQLDHWRRQAETLTRSGFRLRELKPFILSSGLGHFYAGPGGLGQLAAAIDAGGDPGAVARGLSSVFPPAPPVERWNLAGFRLAPNYQERLETLDKAKALAYTGTTEAFAMAGQGRSNWLENHQVYEHTLALFEDPQKVGGAQQARDLLMVHLNQLVDLGTQEQAMMSGLVSTLAFRQNQVLVRQREALLNAEGLLGEMSRQQALFAPIRHVGR